MVQKPTLGNNTFESNKLVAVDFTSHVGTQLIVGKRYLKGLFQYWPCFKRTMTKIYESFLFR
jgi:hypothetical protein